MPAKVRNGPKSRKLKVFRTPIGFHDAYVAAPSQKAAIEAWGSGKDVFQRGEAELVTDPKLTAEPLANPGKIIKRLRGTAEEQLAALPRDKPKAPKRAEKPSAPSEKPRTRPARKPVPSRQPLTEAEEAIDAAEADYDAKLERLRDQEARLKAERAEIEKARARALKQLEAARDKAKAAYDRAIERWRAT